MLGSLFKQGWQSDSVDTRLSSIEKMDFADMANQDIFEQIANNDTELSVRQSAINKITRANIVFDISESHPDEKSKAHARQAFAKLLGTKNQCSQEQLRQLSISKPNSIPCIIQHSEHANLRTELLQPLSEQQQAEIVGGVEYSETRVQIAENLQALDALEIARKSLKGKDKNAEKLIKEKIDAIHARQKLEQENADNALLLCEKMEYLAEHLATEDWRAEFKGQYIVWSQRWTDMDYTPIEEISRRYNAAFEKVGSAVANMSKISEAQAAQLKSCERVEDYCRQLSSQSIKDLSEQVAQISDKIESEISEWDNLKTIISPATVTQKRFECAITSSQSVINFCQSIVGNETDNQALETAVNILDWQLPELPLTCEIEAQAMIAELTSQSIESLQAEQDKLEKLHKRINRLLGVTKQGHLPQAKRELAAITKAIENHNGAQRTILDERLVKANEVVAKMIDWNDFVTEPKYIELCEAMEKLVDADSKPDKLAKKINSLQEQWKNIGYSECSETHWERFKTAADAAYQPCAEFFKQRQSTRLENLAKREPLLTQMRDLFEQTNWEESPDYKTIEITVRQIMQDWQKIKDVEHRAGQKQWNKLTKIKDKINEKLELVYDANIELKNQIISQTSALLELDVNDQTLSKLKLFQSRWKQVGITRRKQDQAAWKKFKKVSDAVYAKIQGLRQEARAEEDAQINQYRDITRQIQNLAKNATDLADADKQFTQLQTDYDNLPELPQNLPEKLVKNLAADFRRAEGAYNKARKQIKQTAKAKLLDKLKQKAQLCADLEQLDNDSNSRKIEALQAAIEEIEIEDSSLDKQFHVRVANALKCDHQQATDDRKRLCIDLEILLDVESPSEDKSLRMGIQLERMKNKGLGQGLNLNYDTLKQLEIDWLCLPGTDKQTQTCLDKRFYTLMHQSKKTN